MLNAIIKNDSRRSHESIPPILITGDHVSPLPHPNILHSLTGSIGNNVEETLLGEVVEEEEEHLLGTAHTVTLSPRREKVLAWQTHGGRCPDLHGIGEVQHEDYLIL